MFVGLSVQLMGSRTRANIHANFVPLILLPILLRDNGSSSGKMGGPECQDEPRWPKTLKGVANDFGVESMFSSPNSGSPLPVNILKGYYI